VSAGRAPGRSQAGPRPLGGPTDALVPPAAIAFDLDGTLVDTAPDIAHALNTALHEAALAPFDERTVRSWIGDGPDALIRRALAARGRADDSDVLHRRLRAAFDIATLAAPLERGAVFDGIVPVLQQLARCLPLCVVTNKPTVLARAVLAAAGLLQHVCGVHGADAPAQRKPSPLLLHAAALSHGVAPGRWLMVGDGAADVQAAHAAGFRAAMAEWGYGAPALPADARVWRLRTPRQLLRILSRSGAVVPAAACE
jgi:phosphoglycolate phosphatase